MNVHSILREWKANLRDDGAAALKKLLKRKASLASLSAAEPDDAVSVIYHLDGYDPDVVHGLDQGCASLCKEYLATLLQRRDPDFEFEIPRLRHLLIIIRRLLPEQTIVDFHRRFHLWNAFFENFVVEPYLDLRREYFTVLAFSQHIAARHGLAPRQLMPLWLTVCAESGDAGRYDKSYLRVGILGLTRLPLGDDPNANADIALQGLTRWAVAQRPSEEEFDTQWTLFKDKFTHDPEFWVNRVHKAIANAERNITERAGNETSFPIAQWWRNDVGIKTDAHPSKHRKYAPDPVIPNEWKSILSGVDQPLIKISPKIESVIGRQQSYADATGDVLYLVQTACNFGMRLIQNSSAGERIERGKLATSLATKAFEYDPFNVYAWSLMMSALTAAGRVQDAALIGWEAVRRFPENVQWRTQLASVLAESMGEPHEAVSLLRETVEIFPENSYARSQLATILADDLQSYEEAKAILSQAVSNLSDKDVPRNLLVKLNHGRRLRRNVPSDLKIEDRSSIDLSTASARRQLFLHEAGLTKEDDIGSFMRNKDQSAYETYVAERVGASDLPFKTTFAIAFDHAIRKADPSALRDLIGRSRPLERSLIERAIAESEGKVVSFPGVLPDTKYNDRLQELNEALRQNGGCRRHRLLLLRDFAASDLSTDQAPLAA